MMFGFFFQNSTQIREPEVLYHQTSPDIILKEIGAWKAWEAVAPRCSYARKSPASFSDSKDENRSEIDFEIFDISKISKILRIHDRQRFPTDHPKLYL